MNRELVRCFNKAKNKVAEFPRFICEDISWQKATGYIPQPLPKMADAESFFAEANVSHETSPAPKKLGRPAKQLSHGN